MARPKPKIPLFVPPPPGSADDHHQDFYVPAGVPRRGFRPAVVLGVVALLLVGSAGVGAVAYGVPPAVTTGVLGAIAAGFAFWRSRGWRQRRRRRRALRTFAGHHRLAPGCGEDTVATGRLHDRDLIVTPDGLLFPLRGFEAFDWPPIPSREAYDRWKALALLDPTGMSRLAATCSELAADPAIREVTVRDAHLMVTLAPEVGVPDIERSIEGAVRAAADLDVLDAGRRDPVALAAAAVNDRSRPADERRNLFDGLTTFHAHDDVTRAAAARLVDDPDGELALAAAELLGDNQAIARIEARGGALALAPLETDEGALTLVTEEDEA